MTLDLVGHGEIDTTAAEAVSIVEAFVSEKFILFDENGIEVPLHIGVKEEEK